MVSGGYEKINLEPPYYKIFVNMEKVLWYVDTFIYFPLPPVIKVENLCLFIPEYQTYKVH